VAYVRDLCIPYAALWFHNVINLDCGVAVNVFWRHLSPDFYEKCDMYGNKDLLAAGRAERILDRSLKQLESLPSEYRNFYALKMIARIRSQVLDTQVS
jgi:tRNA wybutosine-synthesizing protein 5